MKKRLLACLLAAPFVRCFSGQAQSIGQADGQRTLDAEYGFRGLRFGTPLRKVKHLVGERLAFPALCRRALNSRKAT